MNAMRDYVKAYINDAENQCDLAAIAKGLLLAHGIRWDVAFVQISRELETSGAAGNAFHLNQEDEAGEGLGGCNEFL